MMYLAIKLIYPEPTFSHFRLRSPLSPSCVFLSILRRGQPFAALKLSGEMFPVVISALLADFRYSFRRPDEKKLGPVYSAENHFVHAGNAKKLFIKLLQGTSPQFYLLRHLFKRPLPLRILINLFPQR